MKNSIYTLVTTLAFVSPVSAALSIAFDFDPTNDLAQIGVDNSANDILSAANQALFTNAGAFWETALTGYADGNSRTLTVHASGFVEAAMGGGVVLGSAGPVDLALINDGANDFVISTTGQARFNTGVDAVGTAGLLDGLVIRHEIGHVLGFGILWDTTAFLPGVTDNSQNVYTDGTGQYTGANALAAYRNEFDPNATFVPVELDGGSGTSNGHWNEVTDNFAIENQAGFDTDPGDEAAALTVLSGINAGESLDDEILSGVESGSGFLSDTTLGSFQDIGFTTIGFNAIPIPEPSALIFSFVGLGAFALRRSRT